MIPPQISLGPVKIHFYGALIAIAILVGWYLAKKRAHFYKQSLRSSTSSPGLKQGQETGFVYTLNATAFAIGRTLIAIMENYQQKDGSILIPKALQKYTGFTKIPS